MMHARARLDFQLSYRWEAVEIAPGVPLRFPDEVTDHLRQGWKGPAVYRWVVSRREHGELQRCYVGETEKLMQRINQYRKPEKTQSTNVRIRDCFLKELGNGNTIRLDVLRFEPFALGATIVTEGDLTDKLTRRFLEHLFAVYHVRDGYTLINA